MAKLSRASYFSRLVIRALQILFSLALMGTTGSVAAAFQNDMQCNVPSKVGYNIAAAVLCFLFFAIYTGLDLTGKQYWNCIRRFPAPWPDVAFNALFLIFWIAAVGSSFMTCADLCGACARDVPVWLTFNGQCCDCSGRNGQNSNYCANLNNPNLFVQNNAGSKMDVQKGTQGLDIIMMLLFIVSTTLHVALYWFEKPASSREGGLENAEMVPTQQEKDGFQQETAYAATSQY